MATEIVLQLEALKMLQQWSTWIIALSMGFIGIIGFAFKNISDSRQEIAAKMCLLFMLINSILAVMLVGAIPAIIQKLQPFIDPNPVFANINATGVYGYWYLDRIPLWLIISSQRITFLIGLFFGVWLVWLRSRQQRPGADG